MTRKELREHLKRFALKHEKLLGVYRKSFGLIKTKLYFGLQRKTLKKKGRNLLREITRTLEKNHVRYFLDFGTLLGFIREGGMIAHDRDIDFGIYMEDGLTDRKLDAMMKGLGLKKYREFLFRGKIVETTYTNGVIHIDFFRHQETEDQSIAYAFYRNLDYHYPTASHYTPIELRLKHITGFSRMDLGGFEANIPENYEEFLVSAYTENWRIPDRTWNYLRTPDIKEYRDEYGIERK